MWSRAPPCASRAAQTGEEHQGNNEGWQGTLGLGPGTHGELQHHESYPRALEFGVYRQRMHTPSFNKAPRPHHLPRQLFISPSPNLSQHSQFDVHSQSMMPIARFPLPFEIAPMHFGASHICSTFAYTTLRGGTSENHRNNVQ